MVEIVVVVTGEKKASSKNSLPVSAIMILAEALAIVGIRQQMCLVRIYEREC